ncbi:MAG: damage-inducible protein J [Epulopiscium sp. Nele67-Bin004]|nr:MAG: damage-inducible protein J [Epulopiscium sp. Nele67-Bin004]
MANSTNFTVRIDNDIKKQCEALYSELGVNLTTAINVFLRQSIREGGFPFDVRLNNETLSAILESERLLNEPTTRRYSDVEEALRELKS